MRQHWIGERDPVDRLVRQFPLEPRERDDKASRTSADINGSGANSELSQIQWVLLCWWESGSGYAARALAQISGIVAVSPPSLLM
jgi:hypothetical protein